MNSKSFTNFAALFIVILFTFGTINAQTFNGNVMNTAGNTLIPSSGTGSCTPVTTFNNTVAGTNTAVEKVQINLTHTWCGDLEIYLQAPNGQRIALSTGNGSSGDNYTNTMFVDGAPPVTGGVVPFSGMYSAEGAVGGSCATPAPGTIANLAAFTPGAGLNGTWQLLINDNASGDFGNMIAWSITFAAPPAPGEPCELICPDDIVYNLDPGACEQIINWNPPTTT
ncbi:MAG: proprotein convertase P-domain-containing protein, partial [Saprospiraceae bacterium]|nr:proprotein convertase P-domain-containing protein [Saprospiraceae bacterium]